jgi:hypothetical protein
MHFMLRLQHGGRQCEWSLRPLLHGSRAQTFGTTSGPIPKFAGARVTLWCELRNLRTTSNFMILVRF